jgi:hypothetical protein
LSDQKRVPSTHATEVAGELEIQRVAHAAGWLHRPRAGPDVGVDLELEPVQAGVPTGLIIKVQVKSGASYFERDSGERFAFRVRPSDQTYWARINTPLLLVLFNPNEGHAYAVEFHSYSRTNSAALHDGLVWFDRQQDRLTPDLLLRIGSDASPTVPSSGRASLSPIHVREVLHANVLRLEELPQRLFHAPTSAKNEAEIKPLIARPAAPFLVWNGELWSFWDLRDPEAGFQSAVDSGRVRILDAAVWLSTKDGDVRYRTLLYRHLRQHTRALGLFGDDEGRVFFPSRDRAPRVHRYRSLRQWTQRWVARPVFDRARTKVLLWEHRSLKTELLKTGNSWMLSLIPSWTFSVEGRTCTNAPPGAVTRRISHEYNPDVFRLLVFWRAVLFQNGSNPLVLRCPPQQIVITHNMLSCSAAFGIASDRVDAATLDGEMDDSQDNVEDTASPELSAQPQLERGEHG